MAALLQGADGGIFSSMFHMQLPVLEKVIRPAIMYVVLIAFLRLFGKRELAQLNPVDLVVLLMLSNIVQNAIIGPDNSVSGGILGAFALLAMNWLLMRVLYHLPRLNQALEGSATVLIRAGVVDPKALKQEALTPQELLSVLHHQNFNSFDEVERCVLEPAGTFYVEGRSPTTESQREDQLMKAVERLAAEVADLRRLIAP